MQASTDRPLLTRVVLPAVLVAAAATLGCRGESTEPTLAILNATIWTGDPDAPYAEALLDEGERIVAVGSSDEIRPRIGDATVLDATGLFVAPGFIDAHVHFLDGGRKLSSVSLRRADSPEELARRIGDFAATVPAGTWITGGDWDHQRWGGELPRREMIDDVTPEHPVWVHRHDGHMALANTLALEAAGITRETQEVDGGVIERDADGRPTGVLKDNAMALVDRVVPPWSEAEADQALAAAMEHAAAHGVTTVHQMGTFETLEDPEARPSERHARDARLRRGPARGMGAARRGDRA